MKLEIKNFSGVVLYSVEATSVSELLCAAVKEGANLRGAYLRGAYLGGANLGGANLGGAYLGGAYLEGANLGGANLGGAYLGGANLGGANLGGAYLEGANWGPGCKIQEQTVKWVAPLVFCDNYCKCLCAVDDVAWIMAGCRWFTLANARKHWTGREDRITTLLMLEGIAAVAKSRGLREE